MEYRKQFVRRKPKGEINTLPSMAEGEGFISNEMRIRALMEAGERLQEFREENYDYNDYVNDDGTYTNRVYKQWDDEIEIIKNSMVRLTDRLMEIEKKKKEAEDAKQGTGTVSEDEENKNPTEPDSGSARQANDTV